MNEEKEDEVEEECNLHVEDSDYIIESDSDNDAYYFQAICLMSKQIENKKELQWQIILDTGLSASVFNNPKLLEKIGATSRPLRLITNRGELKANRMGMYQDMKIWFNLKLIANILSFSSVAEKHRIVIDTAKEKDILAEIKGEK